MMRDATAMLDATAILDATAEALRNSAGVDSAYLEGWLNRHRLQLEARVRSGLQPLGVGRLVTLNMGLGRDSMTMLCLLLEGRLIAQKTLVKIEDISAVVFSDTAYEWQHTYNVLPLAAALCAQVGLRFLHLQKPPQEGEAGWQAWLDQWPERRQAGGARAVPPWRQDPPASVEARAQSGYYHSRAPILEDYHSRSTVISINRQDCSSNHKIVAVRRLLEDLALERFSSESNRAWGQEVRKGQRRPHLTLIGYAADEGHRLDHEAGPDYVEEAYPLVEMGIRKADEAPILERWQLAGVRKSGCCVCPFQPVSWYWALRETDSEAWRKVVQYETDALARNPRMTVLPGRKPLEQAVADWHAQNPDATVDQVLDKAYSRCKTAHAPTPQATESIELLTESIEPIADPLLVFVQARVLLRHHLGGPRP